MPFGLEPKDLVIFGAGIIATIIVGYFFYKLSTPAKKLCCAINVRAVLSGSGRMPEGVSLTYEGNPVRGLAFIDIYMWNAGSLPIMRADLATKAPPIISLSEGVRVLRHSIVKQSRAANDVVLEGMEPKFAFLNARDGFSIRMLVEPAEGARARASLKGEVVGINAGVQRKEYDFAAGSSVGYAIMAGTGLFVFLFGVIFWGTLNSIINEGLTFSRGLGLLLVTPALLGFGAALLVSIAIVLSPKMPIELVSDVTDESKAFRTWAKRLLGRFRP
jgi:hypothetical protein